MSDYKDYNFPLPRRARVMKNRKPRIVTPEELEQRKINHKRRVHDYAFLYRTVINPEKWKALNRANAKRVSALKRGAAICDLTPEQWEKIKKNYSYLCAYCRERKPLTQDHVIPLTKGGNHTASNIVPACRSCNAKKGNRDWPRPEPTQQ